MACPITTNGYTRISRLPETLFFGHGSRLCDSTSAKRLTREVILDQLFPWVKENVSPSRASRSILAAPHRRRAELVPSDDTLAKITWTKLFPKAKVYEVTEIVVFRDNQSSMK